MKIRKVFLIISLLIMFVLVFQTCTLADLNGDLTSLKNGMKNVSDGDTTSGNVGIIKGIDMVFYLIRYVGTGVSVIAVLWLGIKYMLSSIEDKAEIKKKAVPFVIGCVLIFGTSNLLGVIIKIIP